MVKTIGEVLRSGLKARVLGFDDAPFETHPRVRGSAVNLVGVVASCERFEGMLYGEIEQDGWNAGLVLARMIERSKFLPQIHAVLLDGITFGGLNVVDLSLLARKVGRVCIAVMRRRPDFDTVFAAMRHLPEFERRKRMLEAAGQIYEVGHWVFQYQCPAEEEEKTKPEDVARLLELLTPKDTQKIPECLRVAHLIGSAIKTGQSTSSA